MPEFYMIFARKINKMPEFYMIFARKIFFPNFFGGGGGQVPPCPPVSYAYDSLVSRGRAGTNDVKAMGNLDLRIVKVQVGQHQ